MSDTSTTVSKLKDMVRAFVDERDWEKFHTPKNISIAMAVEVAELMEHFQWLDSDESLTLKRDKSKMHDVGEELADVLCYAMALANTLGIDISETMRAKMKKNRAKYPVEEYRGRFE